MFIARISRGRTIREFVIGVLLAPTVVSLIWFTVFGDASIIMQRDEGGLAMPDPVTGELIVDSNMVLFQFFDSFPSALALVLSVVAILVVALFFVTSSDSGSLVIDMLACGGRTNTPVITRVYWSLLEGVVAAVLLVAGGAVALTFMQTLSVSTTAPFSVILVLACVSLGKAFRHEVAIMPSYVQLIPAAEPGLGRARRTGPRRDCEAARERECAAWAMRRQHWSDCLRIACVRTPSENSRTSSRSVPSIQMRCPSIRRPELRPRWTRQRTPWPARSSIRRRSRSPRNTSTRMV